MKRDADLIRTLLLKVEDLHFEAGAVYSFDWEDDWLKVEGYDHDTIIYHFNLIVENGFLQTPAGQGMTAFVFSGLSWSGHEFLEDTRNLDAWTKTKQGMRTVGGFGLEIAAQLTKEYAKQIIAEKLGIRL